MTELRIIGCRAVFEVRPTIAFLSLPRFTVSLTIGFIFFYGE